MIKEVNRYSDADLAEFQSLIESKIERAKSELSYYQEQILEITEKMTEEHDDWTDGAMAVGDLELLNDLAHRQLKFIRDLDLALDRIKNKTYGICQITGTLIDKRRLMAVPTTSICLEAKNAMQAEQEKKSKPSQVKNRPIQPERKITHRVVSSAKPKSTPHIEEEEFDGYEAEEEMPNQQQHISLDDIADEYGYEDDYKF